ncbi:integrase [Phaeobacter sp. 11ANDIMAR09]|nr:integrase [Phaeobacter sp. 11ANDIMAR09]
MKSTATSVSQKQPKSLLDEYRSFNSMVETFFKSIKAELMWRNKWDTRRQAEGAIFQYINGFYNSRRRHSSLGGKSPLAFERKAA